MRPRSLSSCYSDRDCSLNPAGVQHQGLSCILWNLLTHCSSCSVATMPAVHYGSLKHVQVLLWLQMQSQWGPYDEQALQHSFGAGRAEFDLRGCLAYPGDAGVPCRPAARVHCESRGPQDGRAAALSQGAPCRSPSRHACRGFGRYSARPAWAGTPLLDALHMQNDRVYVSLYEYILSMQWRGAERTIHANDSQ